MLEEENEKINKDLKALRGEEETCQKESLKEESKLIEYDIEKMNVNDVEEIKELDRKETFEQC